MYFCLSFTIFSIKQYWLRQIPPLHEQRQHIPVRQFNNDLSPCVWMLYVSWPKHAIPKIWFYIQKGKNWILTCAEVLKSP